MTSDQTERRGSNIFCGKTVVRLIVPLAVEQLLAITIGIAATIMVASVGQEAVSAVSLVETLNILLINIFAALTTGGAVVCSQYIGKKSLHHASAAASQLLIIVLTLSVIVMAVFIAGNQWILRLIFGEVEAGVMQGCKTFLFWSALSYPFLAIFNASAALFRSVANSKISMFASIGMNVLNVGSNVILIYIFKMGVAGAGISTLLARVFGAVLMLILLMGKTFPLKIRPFIPFHFHKTMLRRILRIGIPTGFENGLFQLGKILLLAVIAKFGTDSIAANAVCNSISVLPQIPAMAIGLAMVTVVGQCMGACRADEAKHFVKRLTLAAFLSLGAITIIMYLCLDPLISLYNLSDEATAMTKQVMTYYTITSLIFWVTSFTLPNGLRAAGDVKFTMSVSLISMWTFRIALGFILGYYLKLGVMGVWIAMSVDWVVRSICFVARFATGKWKGHKVI